MDLGLADARVLVAGGSRGMGRAAAEVFAREGARVAVLARSGDALEETMTALHSAGCPESLPLMADLTSLTEVNAALDRLGQRWDGLEALVNAAGPVEVGVGPFEGLDDDEWHATFDIGVLSVVRTIRRALPLLRRGSSARIVNVSAHSTKRQGPYLVAYTAAKAALTSLTKNLSQSLAPEGILVNTVSPGSFLSEGMRGYLRSLPPEREVDADSLTDAMRGHRRGLRPPRLPRARRQPDRDRSRHRLPRVPLEQLHDGGRRQRRRWLRLHLRASRIASRDVARPGPRNDCARRPGELPAHGARYLDESPPTPESPAPSLTHELVLVMADHAQERGTVPSPVDNRPHDAVVARSPSRVTMGLVMRWNEPVPPTRTIMASISCRPLARPNGPSMSSPSSANSWAYAA